MNQNVTVEIPYTVETGENLVNETFGPNNIRRRKTGTHELKPMRIQNGRHACRSAFTRREWFCFRRA